MPLSTDCVYEGNIIEIAEAIRIKNAWRRGLARPAFTCTECAEPVSPHQSRRGHTPHIEHLARNLACSLSHRKRGAAKSDPAKQTFRIDDPRALEGYAVDRTFLQYARNATIAEERKRIDDYRCAACDFRLEIEGRFVIECHHLKPVAQSGEREVHIDELVSLCPTCHRIAHTRAEPYSVAELKVLRPSAPSRSSRCRPLTSNV